MILRVFLLACLLGAQAIGAGDQRSELKLISAKAGSGWYEIYAAPRKRVLVQVKGGRISALDVSAEFPYSVSLTESPTPRYTMTLLFSDPKKDALVDSFGVTATDSVEPTDTETHQRLLDDAANGRAIGKKLKEIIGTERNKSSNKSMNPIAPLRKQLAVFATPCSGLSLSR